MRVIHLDTATEWRGGQTQLLELLRARPEEMHAAIEPGAPLRKAIEAAGIPVHPIRFHGPAHGVPALTSLLRSLRPDLVAAHTSRAQTAALLAAMALPAADRPAVVVHRRLDFPPGRGPLDRLKYALPRGYVAVSGAVADVLRRAGVPGDRVTVVHDGVDPAPFLAERTDRDVLRLDLGARPETRIVGAIGALVDHKAHDVLLRALASTVLAREPVLVVIAGEGPLRAHLERLARGLGVPDRVRFLGQRADVPALLRAFDVFCHPSREEGMGQAVVEAMIAGTPVVASAAGGIPEVVRDGETGRLVPHGDPGALAMALREAMYGSAARERALPARRVALDCFGIERMAALTIEAYGRFDRDKPT